MPSFRFLGFAQASPVALSVAQGAVSAQAGLTWERAGERGFAFDTFEGTETFPGGGLSRLEVTWPPHLAAYDAGDGAGVFLHDTAALGDGPVVLYPGAVSAPPAAGGTVSVLYAPFLSVSGTASILYSYWVGGVLVGTGTSYGVAQAPGQVIEIRAAVTDANGTASLVMGVLTVQESLPGPVLTGGASSLDPATGAITFAIDGPATIYWGRFPTGHVFADRPAEVRSATGALDSGSFLVEAGAVTFDVTFAPGNDGPQEVWIVAQNGDGPLSNVIGGPIDILTGVALIAAQGSSNNTAVTGYTAANPGYGAGDLVVIELFNDGDIARVGTVTVTPPDGETVTQHLAPTDDGNIDTDGHSVTLLSYVAAAERDSSVGIPVAISAGQEQFFGVVKVWRGVNATPVVNVETTLATAGVASATSAAFAATKEGGIVNFAAGRAFDPFGAAPPTGWSYQANFDGGAMAVISATRDAATAASESVAATSFPASGSFPFIGVTYVINPL